jgi:hypothetical protein
VSMSNENGSFESPKAAAKTFPVGVCSWTFTVIDPAADMVTASGVLRCRDCGAMYIKSVFRSDKCIVCDSTDLYKVTVEQRQVFSDAVRIACQPPQSNIGLIYCSPVGAGKKVIDVSLENDTLRLRNNSRHRLIAEIRELSPSVQCDAFWFGEPKEFDPGEDLVLSFWRDLYSPDYSEECSKIHLYRASQHSQLNNPLETIRIHTLPLTVKSPKNRGWGEFSLGTSVLFHIASFISLIAIFVRENALTSFFAFSSFFSLILFVAWLIQPGHGRNLLTRFWTSSTDPFAKKTSLEIGEFYSIFLHPQSGFVMRLVFFPLIWLLNSALLGFAFYLFYLTGLSNSPTFAVLTTGLYFCLMSLLIFNFYRPLAYEHWKRFRSRQTGQQVTSGAKGAQNA